MLFRTLFSLRSIARTRTILILPVSSVSSSTVCIRAQPSRPLHQWWPSSAMPSSSPGKAVAVPIIPSLKFCKPGSPYTFIHTSKASDNAGTPGLCWNCSQGSLESKGWEKAFCRNCETLQPVEVIDGDNYFSLFGLEARFELNQDQLEKSYTQLQRQFHPDKFSTRADVEQDLSRDYSSLLNQARNVLREPLQRAKYMLRREGLFLPGDEDGTNSRSGEASGGQLSVETLQEIMQLRMDTEEALAEGAEGHAALVELQTHCIASIDGCLRELQQALDKEVPDWQHALEQTSRLSFYTTTKARIDENIQVV